MFASTRPISKYVRIHILFIFAGTILGLANCSEETRTQPQSSPLKRYFLSGNEFIPLDTTLILNPTNQADHYVVEGSGSIIFRYPRPQDNHYILEFSLKPGGSIKLISNANLKLKQGIELFFRRKESDKLEVFLTALDAECVPGTPSCDISSDFSHLNAAQSVLVAFDIHSHGHVIYFENQEIINEFAVEKVTGTFWGIKIEEGLLKQAQVLGPLKPH